MGPCAGVAVRRSRRRRDQDRARRRRSDAATAGLCGWILRDLQPQQALDRHRPEERPRGRRSCIGWCSDADIVLENFGPGTIERLKCSWEDLRAVNPRLVYLSHERLPERAYENRGALDEVVQMQSGLAYMTGPPGRPLRAGAPIIDILGGVFGVVAALSALRERDLTGRGQKVSEFPVRERDVHAGCHHGRQCGDRRTDAADACAQKCLGCLRRVHREGRRHRCSSLSRPTIIGMRFCEAFGFDGLAATMRGWRAMRYRCDAREWMLPQLMARLGALAIEAILAKCEAASVAYSRVGRPGPTVQAIRICWRMAGWSTRPFPGWAAGRSWLFRRCLWSSGTSASACHSNASRRRIGEHTDAVLAQAGFRADEIADLRKAGVVVSVAAQ